MPRPGRAAVTCPPRLSSHADRPGTAGQQPHHATRLQLVLYQSASSSSSSGVTRSLLFSRTAMGGPFQSGPGWNMASASRGRSAAGAERRSCCW